MKNRPDWLDNATFIVGHPKSGTTLLVALFDMHPELMAIVEETRIFDALFKHLRRRDGGRWSREQRLAFIRRHLDEHVFEIGSFKRLKEGASTGYVPKVGNVDYSSFDFTRFRERPDRGIADSDLSD